MSRPQNFQFYKYQGTGNDFILIDNRDGRFPHDDTATVKALCDRRFGIGADGLILLESDDESDFHMVYFNSDGHQSTMCGNGGRCIVAFANDLGVISGETRFRAIDGMHHASISDRTVTLQMIDVLEVKEKGNYFFLDTGSPHHVQFVKDLESMDVKKEGARLRYGMYGKAGSNINFVKSRSDDAFAMRTYERGVEDETLSCGTGVTAVALAMHHANHTDANRVAIATQGGDLEVTFLKKNGVYTDVHLIGKAEFVFKGEVTCPC
ncbi:MAG: diaminopimelate epimerase [Flavobacteriaceae bacterium]|nr:diaminopimelate epimerase [Flavobacteriaceae bacterium]